MRTCYLLSITLLAAAGLTLFTAGCGGVGGAGLPSALAVDLPDGTTTQVAIGTGPQSLANSRWAFYRSNPAGQGARFITLVFDADGGIEQFADNTIGAQLFGSTIILDGQRHATQQQGVTYAAAVYGAETEDTSNMPGIAFEARLNAFASVLTVASAEASAMATFDDETRTTMTGTFYYKTESSYTDIPEANEEDEFPFVAQRVEEAG